MISIHLYLIGIFKCHSFVSSLSFFCWLASMPFLHPQTRRNPGNFIFVWKWRKILSNNAAIKYLEKKILLGSSPLQELKFRTLNLGSTSKPSTTNVFKIWFDPQKMLTTKESEGPRRSWRPPSSCSLNALWKNSNAFELSFNVLFNPLHSSSEQQTNPNTLKVQHSKNLPFPYSISEHTDWTMHLCSSVFS